VESTIAKHVRSSLVENMASTLLAGKFSTVADRVIVVVVAGESALPWRQAGISGH
jgi:hypothetical protein